MTRSNVKYMVIKRNTNLYNVERTNGIELLLG